MSSAMYLRNRKECAVAAKVLRLWGCKATVEDVYRGDRHVINVARRYGCGSADFETVLMRHIESKVKELRARERAEREGR